MPDYSQKHKDLNKRKNSNSNLPMSAFVSPKCLNSLFKRLSALLLQKANVFWKINLE